MKIQLSKEALASLPAADEQGIIRVQAALRLSADGKADLMEVNDNPVGDSGTDDADPMPQTDVPNLDKAETAINDPTTQQAPLY